MARRRAFALIELLVVVSIVAMLVALLLPALHGARRQARAAACQASLHQWVMILQQYTSEHEGRWFNFKEGSAETYWWEVVRPEWDWHDRALRCPAHTDHGWGYHRWSYYLLNAWIHDVGADESYSPYDGYFWRRVDSTRSPGTVPVFLDSYIPLNGFMIPTPMDPPPPYEGTGVASMGAFCVPRHGSFVNSVFMDWSVRKVGLKELWTLKWHRAYDTSGPWTKAGRVLPGDWPQWMQGFRDY